MRSGLSGSTACPDRSGLMRSSGGACATRALGRNRCSAEDRPMNVEHILVNKGREVKTIRPNASLEDALQRLRQDRISALVVSTDGAKIEGILSDRDILYAIADHGTDVLG